MAAVAEADRCGRCGGELAPGVVLRVFEGTAALCGSCARKHAPRKLVAALPV